MTRNTWAVLVVGLLAVPAWADETYTFKLKKEAKGDDLVVEKTSSMEGTFSVTGSDGKIVGKGDPKSVTKIVFRETILEKKGDEPATKVRRTYEKASETTNGEEKSAPFVGKTVVIEKLEKGYRFQIENGEELKGADAELLANDLAGDFSSGIEAFFPPKNAVKVGESWKLDMKTATKVFLSGISMVGDETKATGDVKLIKVYTKDGAQFGVIGIRVEIPLKSGTSAGQPVTLKEGSKYVQERTLDLCIDGSTRLGAVALTVTYNTKGTIKTPNGMEFEVVSNAKMKAEETRKAPPKK